MVKEASKRDRQEFSILRMFFYSGLILSILFVVFIASFFFQFEKLYQNKIYPGVIIDNIRFGGKTKEEVEQYFNEKNKAFENIRVELTYEDKIATISGSEMQARYDSQLSSTQAYLIGRSGNLLSDIYQKWRAKNSQIRLKSVVTFNQEYLEETFDYLSSLIDQPSEDALFNFKDGKVKVFKPSKNGLKLNREKTQEQVLDYILTVRNNNIDREEVKIIGLDVVTVYPDITTENSNNFGIKEQLGVGKSKFTGSIAGRIHNIELAASRISGRLIPPGETFSFNNALGDVSASTGFQPAYVIKDGRTVLGDGGGVCQVSTTLFRAALNSGLPIEERHAHSYRVSYYEQDSGPGIDATVFAPSVDLKFKNDTSSHILIQAETDTVNKTLVFSLYGTSDGRKIELTKPVILSQTPPPPDLYQDDPTLAKGVVKQVDWRAWGAKVNFDYKVTRNGETIFEKSFFSNFQPWQAVFLRGTRE
ncbi:hypothetical protein A3D78_02300 [Candidatus Gottesmanbacteria bacterium RIFCSPHIGHO2_02_FULL_39_14]|uniref:YoaR-like putative peptidoglycan binding domain-containing protein n=2 Tax=Candidatus Gottesmaniibacteriota TaxID=1752720 RepID=A0A1F6A2D4_9BACT|nr:MAG: hypothetical protein A3D78_02300 [Candidatus Gottesmanbacteria bacterium RIFCSPHIGHO2_02_FULL_39_14]OGG31158.1 MAG: hypothetical protein A3I51_00460 [Candidatus Gottesmanbacteria bacterium RIFCSPLOWO2_02_FULL_38_8]